MAVNSVNYRNVAFGNTSNFSDLVSKPQAYTQNAPAAAKISEGGKKSHKVRNVILATLALAVAVGVLSFQGKKIDVSRFENNKVLKPVMTFIQDISSKIASSLSIAGQVISDFVSSFNQEAVKAPAKDATEKAKEAAADKVKDAVGDKVKDAVVDKAKEVATEVVAKA